jgi:hypothetical protein
MNTENKDLKDYLHSSVNKKNKYKNKNIIKQNDTLYNPNTNVYDILNNLDDEIYVYINKEWNKLKKEDKQKCLLDYLNIYNNKYNFTNKQYNLNKQFLFDNIETLDVNYNINSKKIIYIKLNIENNLYLKT